MCTVRAISEPGPQFARFTLSAKSRLSHSAYGSYIAVYIPRCINNVLLIRKYHVRNNRNEIDETLLQLAVIPAMRYIRISTSVTVDDNF